MRALFAEDVGFLGQPYANGGDGILRKGLMA